MFLFQDDRDRHSRNSFDISSRFLRMEGKHIHRNLGYCHSCGGYLKNSVCHDWKKFLHSLVSNQAATLILSSLHLFAVSIFNIALVYNMLIFICGIGYASINLKELNKIHWLLYFASELSPCTEFGQQFNSLSFSSNILGWRYFSRG